MFPNTTFVRESIAHHFRRSLPTITEDGLLRILDGQPTRWDAYWGVLALRDVGTAKAIPTLRALLTYPMQDVKDCSLLTIAHIAGASETPWYVQALTAKGTRKIYPMWAIEVAADEQALTPVVTFVVAALKKKDPGDAYLSGIKYLARIGFDRPEAAPVSHALRAAWARLPEGHRRTLAEIVPHDWRPASAAG